MIAFVKGKVFDISEDHVIIDNNGIGYIIYMPLRDIEKIKKKDDEVLIHTYHYVREDGEMLYGFYNRESLHLFKNLIGVSGVGPKAGLSILSTVDATTLVIAVAGADDKTIAKAPGIGKKTAQRIILELRDKFKKLNIEEALPLFSLPEEKVDTSKISEAIEALMALGYSKTEASNVVTGIDAAMSLEDIIKEALKHLMRG
ncbi:MAG: Holliday junction branch migration protein RuvA [Clostridium sp.]|uniref:Holliday junction branch migration protein RuvA n=1 Tax=Clostridium sp. TaxID=1506 RepID=UPI002FC5FE21